MCENTLREVSAVYYIGIVTGALLLLGTLAVLGLGKHAVSPESDSINIKVPILGTIKTRNPMVFIDVYKRQVLIRALTNRAWMRRAQFMPMLWKQRENRCPPIWYGFWCGDHAGHCDPVGQTA